MSRLTDLMAKATPRPWNADTERIHDEVLGHIQQTIIEHIDHEEGDYEFVARCNMADTLPMTPPTQLSYGYDDAALICALRNHADAIQTLWDAAIEHTEGRDVSAYELRDAVEALRDLCGGDE